MASKAAPAPAKAAPAPAKAAPAAASKADEKEDNENHTNSSMYGPEYKPNPPHLDGVGDLSALTYLEEDNVVHNLLCRYSKTEVYSNVSNILIAINPYQSLPIYGAEWMIKFRGVKRQTRSTLSPHPYNVGEEAFQNLAKTSTNQSMVICGESGSGKTETAKLIMRYLAHTTAPGQVTDVPDTDASAKAKSGVVGIEDQFLQANPILEAFGNAQTTMNNNSSRFGKFTKVLFESDPNNAQKGIARPRIVGSYIETYLLEKSRVVFQERGERNYHIFYEMCWGMDEDQLEKYRIHDLAMFQYLTQTWRENSTADRVGLDNITEELDRSRFQSLCSALSALNVNAEQQDKIFSVVAGILHLGNIGFVDQDEHTPDAVIVDPHPSSSMALITSAELLGIPMKELNTRLVSRTIKVGVQMIVKPLKQDEAVDNRDAVSKALYHGLFLYIVRKINQQLMKNLKSGLQWIGILDVFGFECSDYNNSFEQFCINFANERLQQYFNEHVIQSEQQEYLREALPWTPLQVADNQDTIDLVESKPNGIIATLDSACVMPKGTDAIFIDNLFNVHKKHPRIKMARERVVKQRPNRGGGARAITVPQMKALAASQKNAQKEKFLGFTIAHYAGSVTYNSEGFLSKNADSIHPDTVKLFGSSANFVTKELLDPPAPSAAEIAISNSAEDAKAAAAKPAPGAKGAQGASLGGFQSVGSMFSKQLGSLMKTLRSTQPHFIRCINPNQFKEPSQFDHEYVRPQLRCGGLIEALRVLKLGFPSRCTYESIYQRFGHLYPGKLNHKDFAECVFVAFGLERKFYQLGLTKVFFRPGKQEFLEEILASGANISPDMVKKIKSLMVRKRVVRAKAGVLLLVRLDLWIKKLRVFRRISRAAGIISTIVSATSPSLKRIKRKRAVESLQAHIRTQKAVQARAGHTSNVVTLQKWVRKTWRKRGLLRVLDERLTQKKMKRNALASKMQKWFRRNRRRRLLRKEITGRVEKTRERISRQKAMEKAKFEEEEKQRRQKLEEERTKAEKGAEEARKKEAELRQKQAAEEAERKRKEEEDKAAKAKALDEARHKKAQEEEEARLAEEARQKEQEVEEARRRQDARERRRSIVEKAQQWQEMLAKREQEKADADAKERVRLEAEEVARVKIQGDEQANKWAQQAHSQGLPPLPNLPPVPPTPGQAAPSLPSLPPDPNAAVPGVGGVPLTKPPPPAEPIPERVKKHNVDRRASLVRAKQKQELEAELQFETKEEERAFFRQVLLNGGKFLKYGRSGAPHIKYVCVNVLGNLFWDNAPIDPCRLEPCETFVKLKDIVQVMKGKQTEVLKRKVAERAPDWLCFSITTSDRTVDFQAVNIKERELWVRAIESGIADARDGVVNFITGDTISRMIGKPGAPATAPAAPAPAPGKPSLAGVPITDSTVAAAQAGTLAMQADKDHGAQRARAQSTAITSKEEQSHGNNAAVATPTVFSPVSDMFLTDEEAFLETGEQLIKYGRAGKPRKRWVNCTKDKLYWGDYPQPSTHALSSSIELSEVLRVRLGRVTEVFKRSVAASSPEECCFSLILRDRTVDFQAGSRAKRNQWVQSLINTVQRAITEAEILIQNREKHRQMMLERKVMAGAQKGGEPSLSLESDTVTRSPSESISVSLDNSDELFNQSRGHAPRSQTVASGFPPLPNPAPKLTASRPAPPPPMPPTPPLPTAPSTGAAPPLPGLPPLPPAS